MSNNVLYVLNVSYKGVNTQKEVYYWRKKKDAINHLNEIIVGPRKLKKIELFREDGLSFKELKTINL